MVEFRGPARELLLAACERRQRQIEPTGKGAERREGRKKPSRSRYRELVDVLGPCEADEAVFAEVEQHEVVGRRAAHEVGTPGRGRLGRRGPRS